ncbi:hypothetical protein KDM41_04520 [bacterium]|nr:hypothetical protein [bacterium]
MSTTPLAPGEYRLDVGGAVIALHCTPAGFAEGLARWFDRPSAAAAPHVRLDIELVPHADDPRLPTSLVTTKRVAADGSFDIADGLVRGRFDAATGRGQLRVKQVLAHGNLVRIFEQLLYQAFRDARRLAGWDGFLLHSSAVIAHGKGFVFVGPSGAGKSTVARLSAGHHVLGDEMNLLRRRPDGWQVVGTPFNGLFRAKRPGEAPLAAVFLLRQAPRHALAEAPPLAAATTIAAEIAPPVGLAEAPDAGTLPAMLDMAAELVGQTSLKFLDFLPDEGFWRRIGEVYGFPDA